MGCFFFKYFDFYQVDLILKQHFADEITQTVNMTSSVAFLSNRVKNCCLEEIGVFQIFSCQKYSSFLKQGIIYQKTLRKYLIEG